MQQRWIKKQLVCPFASRNAGTWNSAKGGESLASFLKKIQEETGAVIESATVLHGGPPCEGHGEKMPPAEDEAKPEPMEEEDDEVESVKVKAPAEKKPESPTPSKDESFMDDADGSIAEAIGRT